MSNFLLVDLNSQADAFARHIEGWTTEKVLDFMKEFGQVRIIFEFQDDKTYAFHSTSGKRSCFRFTKDGQLVILGDNTTYIPNKPESDK